MPLLPPKVGSYEPLLELASGGMATVYVVRLAGAQGFERIVVMKRVHPHLVGDSEFRAMFLDEARLSSLIKHPNVVPVIDVVEEAGELFLIMEYIESISLAQLLKALGRECLSPPFVSRIVCDVLSGLHAAHEAVDLRGNAMNIIHRDVSPQNIIVGVDGTSRLIDFGIAKASSRLTPTTRGALKGKCGYMAPEHIRQRPLDRRADVFAAGVVMHEALTSTRLFEAGDEADSILGVLLREVPDPSAVVPGLPKEMDAVVHRALARDRDERFSTALDFAAATEVACPPVSPREIASLVRGVCATTLSHRRMKLQAALERSAVAVGGSGSDEVPIVPKDDPLRVRRRGAILVVGVLAVALTGGALAVALPRSSRPTEPTPSPPAVSVAVVTPPPALPTPPVAPPATASSIPASSSSSSGIRPPPSRPATPSKPMSRPTRGSDIHKNNPYLDP